MIVDVAFAVLALAGLGTFLYIIIDFVTATEIALAVVFVIGFAMAAYDFFRAIRAGRDKGGHDG
ncbi:MAG: hypothetical protein ACFBWO_09570 [Paracoccaceae bacterium]